MSVRNKCQTRDIRTIHLIEYIRDKLSDGDTQTQLHAILCMNHAFDSTAADVLMGLINHKMIAEALDKIIAGEPNFRAWDLGKQRKETASKSKDALQEVRAEIARLNTAAGETVFNPTATALLDELIEETAA